MRTSPLSASTGTFPAHGATLAQAVADASTIAAAPDNCANEESMPLSQRVSGQQILRGEAPIWAAFPASTRHPLHLSHQVYDLDGGWPFAITWEEAANYQRPIILRASNNQTGKLLKWHLSSVSSGVDATLMTMGPILEPRQPGPVVSSSTSDSDWRSWLTQLLIPEAGCYTIEAIWPESYWRISFSAGL